MMDAAREWLMALVGAAVLCAAAEGLMPEGSVRRVGQLCCGLVLLVVMLRPLKALTGTDAAGFLAEYEENLRREEKILQEQVAQGQSAVIAEHCAAYISDKAAGIGCPCRVQVVCLPNEDGLPLPHSVRLEGSFTHLQQSELTGLLERELGIPPERQQYVLTQEVAP